MMCASRVCGQGGELARLQAIGSQTDRTDPYVRASGLLHPVPKGAEMVVVGRKKGRGQRKECEGRERLSAERAGS